jgi:hypothetical protein
MRCPTLLANVSFSDSAAIVPRAGVSVSLTKLYVLCTCADGFDFHHNAAWVHFLCTASQ